MPSRGVDVAIVGAGPYGLSLASHLKDQRIGFRIFGRAMQVWRTMPGGMHLKSVGSATNIYTSDGRLGFAGYCRERGLEAHEPCAIADFARYGVWAQRQLVPDLEEVDVAAVSRCGHGFELALSDGKTLRARQVVVAAGITHFPHIPAEIASLPPELVSHTLHHSDYAAFAGKDVCILGAGQSAFEAARVLAEAGARPQLLVRGAKISFAKRTPAHRSLWERMRWPESGLGPGLKGRVLESFPLSARLAPERLRVRFVKSHLGPLGAWWLRDHVVGKVPVVTDCTIASAAPRGGRLALRVAVKGEAEREIICDHLVAGTGYEVDVDRLKFLAAPLRSSIRRIEKSPALDLRFQSSVPGLYFVGLASSFSFGPMFRFVLGAKYTSRVLTRELDRRSRSSLVGGSVAHAAEVGGTVSPPAGAGG
jgi:cation diffusion facilitator CzcD-associated flavoprotein CzcO